MNFLNRRFFSPSIREYQISKRDSCPRMNRPEPKPILHEPKVFPQSSSCLNQKHCKDHELIASTLHENVLKPRISKRKHILTWLKNVLLKPFHELCSLSCALKEILFRKRHEPKFLRPKNQFDFIHDKNFSYLALTLCFPDRFSAWPNFKIDKLIFGDQLTCLSLAHVLDDYPKGLDPDLDVLKIEKPYDYFFRRFDVVSLVVLNEQDKHDHNDICSLFDSYLLKHEASTHEITWRMFSTQLRSSSKKNQIKRSSYVIVMLFTNQVIFSSREFRPPEKLEMANLLSDEPTVSSIMLKIQKRACLAQMEKPIKYWLREKMDFDQASKGHVLAHIRSIFFTFQSPGRGYMKSFLVRLSPSFDPSFVGPVRHIRQRSKSGSIFGLFRNP
ncbi:hypothetical protein IGI04_003387 [Brassica rapa subsp. trilocularis]|uniref:Uncharacterized protein n=1 Tax=Brassica rapa subsp. trilocularis TaxID=1813537 RepID=A0ABQ7NYB1_BRACM|nr:hypothetical protein IGI04_003387 [Brassica rapa subsp. trilocularis]